MVGVVTGSPTMGQQQADALGLLAASALHHGINPGAPGERYQVVVHVDADVLADADSPGQSVLEGGTRVLRGNVSAPGVRCEPSGHASRRRWPALLTARTAGALATRAVTRTVRPSTPPP